MEMCMNSVTNGPIALLFFYTSLKPEIGCDAEECSLGNGGQCKTKKQ
jgi:hypothetical protein